MYLLLFANQQIRKCHLLPAINQASKQVEASSHSHMRQDNSRRHISYPIYPSMDKSVLKKRRPIGRLSYHLELFVTVLCDNMR